MTNLGVGFIENLPKWQRDRFKDLQQLPVIRTG